MEMDNAALLFDVVQNGPAPPDEIEHAFDTEKLVHQEVVKAIAAVAAKEIPKDGKLDLTVAVANENHNVFCETHVTFEPGRP